jgi:hypothetical protein
MEAAVPGIIPQSLMTELSERSLGEGVGAWEPLGIYMVPSISRPN